MERWFEAATGGLASRGGQSEHDDPAESFMLVRSLFLICLALSLACSGDAYVAPDTSGSSSCCKVCSAGKACGDSCIDASATCETVGGCACNATSDTGR
jgi:hypothetical protein